MLYFLVAFVVYGVSDWLAFTHAYRVAYWDNGEPEEISPITSAATGNEDAMELVTPPYVPGGEARRLAPYVATIRSFFEFVLPLLVGFYAIWALISV